MKSKLASALLSLAIAFSLWLYVISVVSPGSEDTFDGIPVVIQNESLLTERGLMITSNETPTISLVLSGNRTDLMKLNRGNITVTADVSNIYKAGKVDISYDISFPGDIPDNAVATQRYEPDFITLVVEEKIAKDIDVVINYTGSLPDDFICDKENAVLDYEKINVQGPKSVIDKITQARIEVNLDDRKESFSQQYVYTLCDKDGEPVDSEQVVTNTDAVNLSLKIQRVKEIQLSVNIVDGGGATAATSSIELSHQTIRVSGSESQLEKLDVLELGTIDLGKLLTNTKLTFAVKLPEGITNVSGVSEVTADVKFPNLQTKSLKVTNIQCINVPEGLEVDLMTEELEVMVRGPRTLVSTMRDTDVTVVVNFADAQIGTATFKATINVGSNYSEVGMVGSYSVSATLREAVIEGEEKNGTAG